MKKKYELLDEINFPSDLKKLPESKLQKVADELREEMIDAVSVTGGHLGASLFSGGKKIRSKILIDVGSLFKLDYRTLIVIGAAVECLSLIHI